jgi:hypothetical protein
MAGNGIASTLGKYCGDIPKHANYGYDYPESE